MHDLVHDLAQHVASGEILVLEHKKAMASIDKHCRWLALIDCDISLAFPTSSKKMRGLQFYGTPSTDVEGRRNFKFAPSIFSNAQCLRALYLEDVHTESLLASVSNLRNLRYLHVLCDKPLPESFYNLQNLQTLYLTDCDGLREVPESISRLHSLRSLELVRCQFLVTLPNSIGDLRELRTLEVESSRLQAIPESIGSLHNMQKINLYSCWRLMQLPDSIGGLSNLQELCLCGCSGLPRLPESISNLVRLEKLDLEYCIGLEELPQGLGNMMNLRYLITKRCDSLCGMPLGVGRLTNLQELGLFVVGDGRERYAKVSELAHLNKISGDLIINGLRNARDPEDAMRAKLKEKQNLSSLYSKWNMPADPVFAVVEKEGHDEAVLESLQPHPNIKLLEIWDYPGVSFPKWNKWSSFPNLENINLEGLRNCEHLPPLGLLRSLNYLHIERMDAVKRVGEEIYGIGHHSGNRTVPFPSLEWLRFEDMRNLEEWCTVVEGDRSSSSSSSNGHQAPPPFPCLSTLEMEKCPKLRLHPGFPASVVKLEVRASKEEVLSEQSFQQNASRLRELTISRCNQMSSLPENIRYLTSLQTLTLWSCNEISSLPEWLGDVTSLNSLSIFRCPGLSCLPQGLQRLPSLQSLKIEDCPQLARRCQRDQGEDWHIIAHIPNIEITDR